MKGERIMMTIWKYQLMAGDKQTIDMPSGARPLCVQVQNGVPCLWALCDPSAPKEKRYFEVFGTGHIVTPGTRDYLGTVQLLDGALVLHVFESEEAP